MNLTIRQSDGSKTDVTVDNDATVGDLKAEVHKACDVEVDLQRLIHRGRILKDADKLEALGIESGHTVHMVKGSRPRPAPSAASPAPAPASAPAPAPAPAAGAATGADPFAAMMGMFGGMGGAAGGFPGAMGTGGVAATGGMPGGMPGMDPASMMTMMQNPVVQQMASTMLSNPETLRQMEASNPMLRTMLEANPGMRDMLRSPEFVRSMLNPQMLASAQAMMGAMPGAAGAAGAAANPFAAFMPAAAAAPAAAATPPAPSAATPAAAPAAAAAPAPDFAAAFAQLMGGAPGAAGAAAAPAAAGMEPRELYRDQIAQMAEMGFTDEALCIRALQASGGNVQYAIERLFSGGM